MKANGRKKKVSATAVGATMMTARREKEREGKGTTTAVKLEGTHVGS